MKNQKEIEEMYTFIGFFNDGHFMNQEYRRGIQDALTFVLYDTSHLQNIKDKLKLICKESDDKIMSEEFLKYSLKQIEKNLKEIDEANKKTCICGEHFMLLCPICAGTELIKKLFTKTEISYSKEYDILNIRIKYDKYAYSKEHNNIVLNYNQKNEIISVKIFDATNTKQRKNKK